MVIGFKVYDPRLKSLSLLRNPLNKANPPSSRFPPKNAKARVIGGGSQTISAAVAVFPTSTLASSDIWDEKARNLLQKPRYKKKDLDERRSKVL
jgi:ribonuclease P/MRP protein subunit POP1